MERVTQFHRHSQLFHWCFYLYMSYFDFCWTQMKNIHHKIGLLLCHSHIELRLWLKLRLSWGWYWGWGWFEAEVEVRLRYSWVEVHFVCFRQFWYLFLLNFGVTFEFLLPWLAIFGVGVGKETLNKGRNWALRGLVLWFKICFRSTYVAE